MNETLILLISLGIMIYFFIKFIMFIIRTGKAHDKENKEHAQKIERVLDLIIEKNTEKPIDLLLKENK